MSSRVFISILVCETFQADVIVLSLYFHSLNFADTFLSKAVKHQKDPILQITLFDECFCYLLNNLFNKAAKSSQMQQNTTHCIKYLIKKKGKNC